MYIDPIGTLWIGDFGFPLWWALMAIVIFVLCPLLYCWVTRHDRNYSTPPVMELDHKLEVGAMIEDLGGHLRPVTRIIQQYRKGDIWIVRAELGAPIRWPNLRRWLAEWWHYVIDWIDLKLGWWHTKRALYPKKKFKMKDWFWAWYQKK